MDSYSNLNLAIVGSHVLTPRQRQAARLVVTGVIYTHMNDICPRPTIGSGEADEVDTMVKEEATRLGLPYVPFHPKRKQWEPDGYKERNLAMARWCDHLICIRAESSKTYGSGWTAEQAEMMGKEVTWIKV